MQKKEEHEELLEWLQDQWLDPDVKVGVDAYEEACMEVSFLHALFVFDVQRTQAAKIDLKQFADMEILKYGGTDTSERPVFILAAANIPLDTINLDATPEEVQMHASQCE